MRRKTKLSSLECGRNGVDDTLKINLKTHHCEQQVASRLHPPSRSGALLTLVQIQHHAEESRFPYTDVSGELRCFAAAQRLRYRRRQRP